MDKLLAHDASEPPPLSRLAGLPAGLSAVVARMMAKDREDRYQTPAEVGRGAGPVRRWRPRDGADGGLRPPPSVAGRHRIDAPGGTAGAAGPTGGEFAGLGTLSQRLDAARVRRRKRAGRGGRRTPARPRRWPCWRRSCAGIVVREPAGDGKAEVQVEINEPGAKGLRGR